MPYTDPLIITETVRINVSSITVKRGTYIQLRIPKQDCTYDNPSYHLMEVEVKDDGTITIHATPGTPSIQIWED